MFNNWEKEKKVAEKDEKIIEDLRITIGDEISSAFLNKRSIDQEKIRREVLDLLPHTDSIMLDVRLDKFIEQMETDFKDMEIMIKEDPKILSQKVSDNLDFLLSDL